MRASWVLAAFFALLLAPARAHAQDYYDYRQAAEILVDGKAYMIFEWYPIPNYQSAVYYKPGVRWYKPGAPVGEESSPILAAAYQEVKAFITRVRRCAAF